MKLQLLNFAEYLDTPSRWEIDKLTLRDRNLVVGVNASGKSRTLRSIDILASLLSKRMPVSGCAHSLNWRAEFSGGDNQKHVYELEIRNGSVISEQFTRDGEPMLERPSTGKAQIRIENNAKQSSEVMEFKIPASELAAPNKMDLIQTPFLAPLINWADSVFYYRFGTSLGQEMLGVKITGQFNIEAIDHDQNAAMPHFSYAMKHHPDDFSRMMMADMGELGYRIDDAALSAPKNIISAPQNVVAMTVKETELEEPTNQLEMSQGMYRAFALLVHANYLLLSKKCGCLLIDDIGEGLDFERSGILIDLLTQKGLDGGFQLVMSTNDRFIMNHIPLRDWTIIRRSKGRANIYNYETSKQHFDEFRFTGLNNFDFFSMDFLKENLEEHREEQSGDENDGDLR